LYYLGPGKNLPKECIMNPSDRKYLSKFSIDSSDDSEILGSIEFQFDDSYEVAPSPLSDEPFIDPDDLLFDDDNIFNS
jgi:hypothetical protein